jgi:hypothetical protein
LAEAVTAGDANWYRGFPHLLQEDTWIMSLDMTVSFHISSQSFSLFQKFGAVKCDIGKRVFKEVRINLHQLVPDTKHCVSIRITSQSMRCLFGEIMAAYCESHKQHTNIGWQESHQTVEEIC